MKKNNNKGFSLIEVIVAITVLSIIAFPLANSFLHATKLNAEARRVRGANVVAQGVLEEFGSKNLDTLLAEAKDSLGNTYYTYTPEEKDAEGNITQEETYKFSKYMYDEGGNVLLDNGVPYIFGPNNERLFVDVTMTPANYVINNYCVPSISDIYYKENIMINADLNVYDAAAISKFRLNYGITDKRQIKKKTTLTATVTVIESVTEATKYEVAIRLKFEYEANGTVLNYSKYVTTKTVSQLSDLPNVYLLYTIFDKTGITTDFTADDVVDVELIYVTDNSKLPEKQLNVYLIEQETTGKNVYYQEGIMHISNSNVNGVVKKQSVNGSIVENVSLANNYLKLYTNVLDVDNLTSSDKTEKSLFKVTVEVYQDAEKTKQLLSVSSSKEIIYAR